MQTTSYHFYCDIVIYLAARPAVLYGQLSGSRVHDSCTNIPHTKITHLLMYLSNVNDVWLCKLCMVYCVSSGRYVHAVHNLWEKTESDKLAACCCRRDI